MKFRKTLAYKLKIAAIAGGALFAINACDDDNKIKPEKPHNTKPDTTVTPPVTKETKIIFSPTDYAQTLKLSEVKRITDDKTYTRIIFYTDAYYGEWFEQHFGALRDKLLNPAIKLAGDRGECQGYIRLNALVDTTSNEIRWFKQKGFTVDYQK